MILEDTDINFVSQKWEITWVAYCEEGDSYRREALGEGYLLAASHMDLFHQSRLVDNQSFPGNCSNIHAQAGLQGEGAICDHTAYHGA